MHYSDPAFVLAVLSASPAALTALGVAIGAVIWSLRRRP